MMKINLTVWYRLSLWSYFTNGRESFTPNRGISEQGQNTASNTRLSKKQVSSIILVQTAGSLRELEGTDFFNENDPVYLKSNEIHSDI